MSTLAGFVVICVVALAMGGVGIPLWLRKVPPNRLYGFRTRRTLSDEAIWYRTNALLGRNLIVAMVLFLIVAAVVRWTVDSRAAISALAPLLAAFVLIAAWLADRESRR